MSYLLPEEWIFCDGNNTCDDCRYDDAGDWIGCGYQDKFRAELETLALASLKRHGYKSLSIDFRGEYEFGTLMAASIGYELLPQVVEAELDKILMSENGL